MKAEAIKSSAGKSLIAVTIYVCGNIICGILDFVLESKIHISPIFTLVFNAGAMILAIKTIQPASLKKTVIVSFIAHVIAILFLSLTIKHIPLNEVNEPIFVTIETGEAQTAYGVDDTQNEPSASRAPTLRERIAQADARLSAQQENPIRQGLREIADYGSDNNTPVRTATTTQSTYPVNAGNNQSVQDIEQNVDNVLNDNNTQNNQNNSGLREVDENVMNALNNSSSSSSSDNGSQTRPAGGDPLSDASWSAAPRKTIFFPDIESAIPAEYRQRGMSYEVRVRISFDKNGYATQVDLLQSSGDTTIDNLFLRELRKIRVEEISANRTDTVTKTFKISLR